MKSGKKMPAPLISILLPAYKHERYIGDTLCSLIAQTYPELELLIIDDGSPDDTWGVIESLRPECEKRFRRVVMQRQQNAGVCATYNKLLALAEGKYVFIVNSDDIAKPDAIEILAGFLENDSAYGVAVGNNDLIDADGKKIYWNVSRDISYDPNVGYFETFKEFFFNLKESSRVDFTSSEFGSYDALIKRGNHIPNGYLIRKGIFDLVGGYTDKAPVEDYYIFLQIAKISKIKYIDKILFSYRWHGLNTLSLRSKEYRYRDRTFTYEKFKVDACDIDSVKKSFYEAINKKRYIINFGNVFGFYKIKNMMHKKFFLQLFGKSFEIYSRDRSIEI